MAQITIWCPAGTVHVPRKGEFSERFAPQAFDHVVGDVVPMTIEGCSAGRARVIAVEVAEDGSGVSITFEEEWES